VAPIAGAVTGHIDAAGGGDQDEMCHQMRVAQCQLQRDEAAHRLPDQCSWHPDGASNVVNQVLIIGALQFPTGEPP